MAVQVHPHPPATPSSLRCTVLGTERVATAGSGCLALAFAGPSASCSTSCSRARPPSAERRPCGALRARAARSFASSEHPKLKMHSAPPRNKMQERAEYPRHSQRHSQQCPKALCFSLKAIVLDSGARYLGTARGLAYYARESPFVRKASSSVKSLSPLDPFSAKPNA